MLKRAVRTAKVIALFNQISRQWVTLVAICELPPCIHCQPISQCGYCSTWVVYGLSDSDVHLWRLHSLRQPISRRPEIRPCERGRRVQDTIDTIILL